MKKRIRGFLFVLALFVILLSGYGITESVEWKEIQTVSPETDSMRVQRGELHMDIAAWELLLIGGGYLAWAAVSWDWNRERRYRRMEKSEYAAQE